MDKTKVLQQLAEEWNTPIIKENEFTSKDLDSAMKNISRDTIRKKMAELRDEGIVQSRSVKRADSSGTEFAYSPAEGKSWEDVLQYIKKK